MQNEVGLPYLIARVEHAIGLRANQALAGLGLTVRQMGALEVIAATPGTSSVEVAREVLLTRQTMNAMVADLVARGAVDRTAGTGRVMHLRVTDTGQDLLRRAADMLKPVEDDLFGPLSDVERRTFRSYLQTVLDRAGDPVPSWYDGSHRPAHRAQATDDPSAR